MDYNRSLGSNLQPLAARGHRSVGAGSLDSLELSQLAGPQTRPNANALAGGNVNKEQKCSARGWNSSTRSSPAWKRNAGKENAENAAQRRPVASKKFQHVQCKLPAPLFQKRQSANTGAPNVASPRPALMVASAAENKALPTYSDVDHGFGKGLASLLDEETHGPEGPVLAVPEAFITTRRGSLVPSPLMLDARDSDDPDVPSSRRSRRSSLPAELSTFYGDNDDTADFDEDEPECYGDNEVEAAPGPVRSPHPSIAALYHFTREVCTPASAHASLRPALSSTPTECADLVRRLEGALDEHTSESGGDELLGSFPSWLASMGLTTVSLSQEALDKMRALWAKAKEAVQLQALVDNLKESELQLAQQEAAENERHVDLLLAENQDLAAAKRRLQEQLQEAEARLAQLSAPHPSAPSPGQPASPLACTSSSTVTAVSARDYAGRVTNNACASPGPVAPIAVSPGVSAAVAGPDVLPCSPAAADTQTSSLSLGCDSPALGPHGPAPTTHSWGDAPATTGSLTTISHLPQHVPFGAWAACALNPDTPASQGAVAVGPVSPSSAAGSAGQPMHNPADAPTPSEAASLSMVSCTPARVPFDAWRAAGAAELTPGAASDDVPSNAASLSVVSHTPQHVPFEAWYASGAAALANTPGFGSGAGSCAGECPEALAAASPEWSFSAEDQPEDAALGAMATPEHTTTSLSVLSRMPEALPFAAWAAAGAAEATTPTALSACSRSVNKPSAAGESNSPPAGSPMLWSPTPWFNPDLARACSPEPASAADTPGASHASPQPSAGLSMASQGPRPVAFAHWAQQEQQHDGQQDPDAAALSPASTAYGLSPLPQHGLDTPGDKCSPGPEILCNPLFDTNSAPPSLAATPLPERNDALPSMGSGGCLESHSRGGVLHFSPACASAASPIAQGMPYSDAPVQEAQEQQASPDLLARFGSRECDASAAPSPAGKSVPTAVELAGAAAPSPVAEEEQAISAGAADVVCSPPHAFTRGPSAEPQSVEQQLPSPPFLLQLQAVDSSSLGTPDAVRPGEASTAEASPAAVDPATPPGAAQSAPSAAMSEVCSPAAEPAPAADADHSAPATPQDATAPQEPATASPATPPLEAGLKEAQPNELHASGLHDDADESSRPANSYPNTPQPDFSDSPGSTIFATPLEAFPTPGSFLSLYSNARSGLATQNGQHGQPRSGVATPASFSFGMGALPFAMTPNQLPGSGVATPASFRFGMGGLPVGAVLASGSEAEDAPTPASFSFAPAGLVMAAAQLLGGAAMGTPGTPALAMKLAPAPAPVPDSSSGSPAAAGTPVSGGVAPQGVIPCSPVPLVQLTPVHLRALDALAVHVMSELRPGLKMQQLQGSGSPISPPAVERAQQQEQQQPPPTSPAGFSFMQLLAQLRSPMPLAAHRSLAAQHHTAAAPKPRAAQPSTAEAPTRSSSSQVQLPEQKAQEEQEAAPSGVISAGAMPISSGLPDAPAFAQLLAFLHGAGPAAARGHGSSSSSADQGPGAAAGTADREAPSPAAVHAFKHLLSHLCSPLPGGGAARVPRPQQPVRSPLVFGLPVLDEVASGSPGLLGGGMHDSPATSEAASFGFSTAAKQMTNRTPASNACNVSFMRWPQDAAPPTFGLGTDATGGVRGPRRMSPLGSPISFAFAGHGLAFRHAAADQDATPSMPGARAAGDAEGCPSAGPVVGAQSFGDRLQLAASPTMPGSAVSPCPSLALSFCHGVAGSPAFSLRGGAGASPSFSFGTAPSANAAAHCSTPSAAMGTAHAGQQPGDAQDGSGEPQADHSGAGVSPSLAAMSPAMSLGAWGAMAAYSGFYGSARRMTAASPGAASEFSFGFGAAPSHVGTPALAAISGSPNSEDAADGAAASPEATVPAVMAEAAAFWTSLLSNLCSPLPAGGLARLREGALGRQAVPPMQPMPSFAAGLADAGAQANAASSPVSGEGGTGSVSLAGSPSGVMATAVPDAQASSAAVEEPACDQQGASGTASASAHVPGSQKQQQQDPLPPAYEALPELIAAGLCLSASTSLTMPSAQRACSSVGENPTPGGARQLSSSGIDPGAALDDVTMPLHTLLRGAGAAAVDPQGDVGTPGRLFNSRPTAMTPGVQASAVGGGCGAAAGFADSLVVESVCHSCSGSTANAAAGCEAGRTTEPVPTPSRLLRTAASACPPAAEADSVHTSPVLSFGSAVPSAGQAQEASAAGDAAAVLEAMPTPNSRDVSRPQSMGSGGAVGPAAATAGVTGSELADRLGAMQAGANQGADKSVAPVPQLQPSSSAPVPAASCSTGAEVAFSADAVQELLFAAGDAEPEASVEGTVGAAAAVSQQEQQGDGEGHTRSAQSSPKSLDLAPSAAAAALASVLATPDAKAAARSAAPAAAAAPEQLPSGGALTPSASAASPAPSGRPSVYDGLPSPLASSTPLSYPGSGTLPTTPLSGARLGGSSPSASNHFWAPTPAGPTGGSSAERVTLEVLNRRIRTNADMLLDFKGSPGRPNAVPSVTGTVRPGAPQPHAGSNPGAKTWSSSGAAAGPLPQQPTGHGASAAGPAPPAPAATAAAPPARRSRLPPPPNATTAAANRNTTAPADAAAVAAGAAALGVAAAASIHMPLSQRLGLWPAGLAAAPVPYGAPAAAWGVPYMWPVSRIPAAPGVGMPAVGVPVQPGTQAAAARNGGGTGREQEAGARTPSAGPVLPPRPAVESRDVQTTPGLARAAETPSSSQRGAAGPSIRLQPPQRVPVRGGTAGASPTRSSKPPAPKPRLRAAAPLPEASAGSQAGDSDDDSVLSLPVERVIRRRSSLSKPPGRVPMGGRSAAAGGGGGCGGGGGGGGGGVALGEDEVRRRAHVLGMRISPYLRPKKR